MLHMATVGLTLTWLLSELLCRAIVTKTCPDLCLLQHQGLTKGGSLWHTMLFQPLPDMRNLGHLTCIGMQVLSLEASLSALHSERSQSDINLKSRMQELLSELQSTLQVRSLDCS